MGGGRDVVHGCHQRRAAGATQGDLALAVLNRVDGVFGRQFAQRPGDGAKGFGDVIERCLRIELARHDQHRVVGLVVCPVKRLQLGDIDVLDIGARADGRLSVVMPLEGTGEHFLQEHLEGAVFAAFHFVAYHGHFGVKIFALDRGVDHRVGLPPDVPGERVRIGCEACEVVGAVGGSRPIGLQPALGEFT